MHVSYITLLVAALLLGYAAPFRVPAGLHPRHQPAGLQHDTVTGSRNHHKLYNDGTDMAGRPGMKGYYRRPSRAIEKGGGFFVPGLEDEKVRVVTAAFLLFLFAANRFGMQFSTAPQIISEFTGIAATLILFLQGLGNVFDSGEDLSLPASSYLSVVQSSFPSDTRVLIDSLVRSIVSTTEGVSYVLILSKEDVLFEYGPVNTTPLSSSNPVAAEIAAMPAGVYDIQSFGKDKKDFSDRLPGDTKCMSVISDPRGWIWVVGSNRESRDMKETSENWVESLVSMPMNA